MTDARILARNMVKRYQTRDPFQLAEMLGYTVIYTRLVGLRGMLRTIHRCRIIFINEDLDERQRAIVCAHELGHGLMHKGLNRCFMDRCTYMTTGKYEKEAHCFSVESLFGDDELQEMLAFSSEQVANWMGVPTWLAEYRMRSVDPKFL